MFSVEHAKSLVSVACSVSDPTTYALEMLLKALDETANHEEAVERALSSAKEIGDEHRQNKVRVLIIELGHSMDRKARMRRAHQSFD